jgi:hypothetical protein
MRRPESSWNEIIDIWTKMSCIQFWCRNDEIAELCEHLLGNSPLVYTIAAGDEWGSLVLLRFSVI